jgi:transcriptional regulator with XRE-family HTH domain
MTKEFTKDDIRALRKALGESQTEFGARFDYTQVHVSFLENGKKPITKVLQLALQTVAREVKKGK